MYQGKNKTAQNSRRKIAGALLELMREQPYEDISVAEICRRAGVSRQTFYTLFHTKENVVHHMLQEECPIHDVPMPSEGENDLQQMCRLYSDYVTRNREILRLLMKNGMLALIFHNLHSAHDKDKRFGLDLQEEYVEYMKDFLAAGMTGLAHTFIDQELSQQEIEKIVYGLLSLQCRK